ncbi:MAG: universal stress protein [Hymenobacteraceae bacterium]|nr:universal stress protein [Hymenobacteraceae bacterium]
MKTLLVPVDFSDNALQALNYAVDLAAKSRSRVLVCHVFETKAVLPGLASYVKGEFRRDAEQDMRSFVERIDMGNVPVETVVVEGDTVREVTRLMEENGVTLVVMGTGGGKSLAKKMFGTTAEAIAKKGLCPVLVIPQGAAVTPITNIVYAADFENGDEVTTMQLLQVKDIFNANLTFLHIKSSRQPDHIDDEYIKENLRRNFPQVDFNFVEIRNDNVAEGIADYVKANDISLLAFTMLSRHVLERVTHISVTSKLLHNLKVPMLAFPENGTLLDLKDEERAENTIL